MSNLQVIETLCRVIEELAALVEDERKAEALLKEAYAAMGEKTDKGGLT